MPTALMPNGRTSYVQNRLEVSVSLPDQNLCRAVERTLKQGLAEDPRQLFVRVQGGGGYGVWCFWLKWGKGSDCCNTAPVLLSDDEHSPEAILEHVRTELTKLNRKSAEVH